MSLMQLQSNHIKRQSKLEQKLKKTLICSTGYLNV